MTLFPQNPVVRLVATVWLVASIALMTVTLLRPEMQANDRAALSTLVPLYFLSLPLGHVGVMAINKIKLALYLDPGNFIPGIIDEGLALWAVLTVLGYVQWFVLLPWLSRKCLQLSRFLFKRDPAR
jgi:hypothetical protein